MEPLNDDLLTAKKEDIAKDVSDHSVVLYMKGNKMAPMCGFSGQVIHILNQIGVEYQDRNVLEDEYLRQGIKDFSDWPAIPQLYVNGEFVGGCDIITELFESGELKELLTQ